MAEKHSGDHAASPKAMQGMRTTVQVLSHLLTSTVDGSKALHVAMVVIFTVSLWVPRTPALLQDGDQCLILQFSD